MSTPYKRLLEDASQSIGSWRVWVFLGLLDVKNRFRRSFLGPAWIFVSLGLTVVGAGIVYGILFHQPAEQFLPLLVTGLVVWAFVVGTFTEGGYAFVGAEGYIKQFSYPKQIFLFRMLVNQAVVLGVGLLVAILTILFFRGLSVWNIVFTLPGIFLLLFAGLGHIVISAYLTPRFRDFPHAAAGFFQVLFFITPIMVPVAALRDNNLQLVYQLNPVHYLIDVVRYPLMEGRIAAQGSYMFGSAYALLIWLFGLRVASYYDSKIVFIL